MANTDKWIPAERAEAVRCTAARALCIRLGAVRQFLPLAADHSDDDSEYVHQLRVCTRRAVAAIDLFEEFIPKREAEWLTKQLKKIRRAAGKARDLDVLASRYPSRDRGTPEWLTSDLLARRRKAQRSIIAIHKRLDRHDRFASRSRAAIAHVESVSESRPTFGDWADHSIERVRRPFFKLARRVNTEDLEILHELRIAAKGLRYSMEILAAAFPEEFRTDLYPRIEDLQDRLGALNDHAIAAEKFRRWQRRGKAGSHSSQLTAFVEREALCIEESVEEFAAWWSSDVLRTLELAFIDTTTKTLVRSHAG